MGRTTGLGRIATFAVSAAMVAFGLGGMASAQTITNTGPDSLNTITNTIKNKCTIHNNNDIAVNNRNHQNGDSGDATVGGSGGAHWTGWARLDPLLAQERGIDHDTWWNDVVDWTGARGSGDGWNSAGDHLDWAPGSDSWSGYDPALWQENGQSFGNWWNGTQSFLDRNNPTWLLGWPGGGQGGGNTHGGSAVTGDVSNVNSSNFAIRVNNAASTAAGVDACGRSLFVAPPRDTVVCCAAPGRSVAIPSLAQPAFQAPVSPGVIGGGFGGFGAGVGRGVATPRTGVPAPVTVAAPGKGAVATPVASPGAACECVRVGGSGGGRVATPLPPAVISNTGPHSSNSIETDIVNKTKVVNDNNISVTNTNNQTGTSGDATVSGNTTGGDAQTGDVENVNETSVTIEVSN